MTGLITALVVVGLGLLGFSLQQRKLAKAQTENEVLRSKLDQVQGDAKVEKLQSELESEQKTGSEAEKKYEDFRTTHPQLFPKDPNAKS